jgi:hypothetical protein
MPVANRDEVVAAARAYLGRPLRHQGRRQALDCVGLVLAVAEDLGLRDQFDTLIQRTDYGHYGPQQVDGAVVRECARRLVSVLADTNPLTIANALDPGRVLVLRAPHVACHAGIVSQLESGPGMIHAYPPSRKVVEHRIDAAWLGRIAGVFAFPEVAGG